MIYNSNYNHNHNIYFVARIRRLPRILPQARKVELNNLEDLKGYVGFIGADVYTPSNKISKRDLLFKDGKLIADKEFDERVIGRDEFRYVDVSKKVITPSILDEHIHGGYGINFNTADENDTRTCLARMKKDGVGGIIVTLLPEKANVLNHQIDMINRIMKKQTPDETRVYGIHLEGPFFSPKKAGIHPPEILEEPTVENFKKLHREGVKIVTIAPELDKGFKLINYLRSLGIIPSAGHSTATAEELRNSGCTQVTHLFNAMSEMAHREPLTIANEAVSNKNISTEINCAFELISPSVMNIPLSVKPKDKIILVSDAIPAANTKEPFVMNGINIFIDEKGVAKSKTGILAGSMEFLSQSAKKIITNTVVSFKDFIRYSSINPARNLGVLEEFQLKRGLKPNFTVWDKLSLSVDKVFTNN